MSLNMFWFLPTHGDGHYLGTEEGSRPVDHGYLQQIAQAADRLAINAAPFPQLVGGYPSFFHGNQQPFKCNHKSSSPY